MIGVAAISTAHSPGLECLCISREAPGPQHHIRATSDFALTAVKAENDLMRHSSRRLHKTRGGGECSQYLLSRDCFAIAAKPAGCSPKSSQPMPIDPTCSCWRCRAAAYLSPMKWPAGSERRSMSLSSASLASPYEELAMGAIATGGVRVLNDQLVERIGIGDQAIEAIAARERQELERRGRLYRGDRPPLDVRGRPPRQGR